MLFKRAWSCCTTARTEEAAPSSHLTLAGFSKYRERGWNLDREGELGVFCAVCVSEGPQIGVLYIGEERTGHAAFSLQQGVVLTGK